MKRIAICLLAGLAGCAVMTPEQCEYADWAALGEQDARQGRAADYIAQRAKACERAGIRPDVASYRMGWEHGIHHFCQPDQGFHFGLGGNSYQAICPTHLEPDFLFGYGMGIEIYHARSAVAAEASAIRSLESTLADPGDLSDARIRDLERELDRRRDNIRMLERELGALEGRAAAMGFGA